MQDFSEKSPYVNARSSLENTIYVTSVANQTLILSKPVMLVSSVQSLEVHNILQLSTDPLTTFQPFNLEFSPSVQLYAAINSLYDHEQRQSW